MNTAFTKFKRITTLLAGISIASIPAVGQADWSITILGDFGGGYSTPWDINDSGQIVGYAGHSDGTSHAFITGINGVGLTDLHNLVEADKLSYSVASSINNSGQVVGWTEDHGFITGPNGVGLTKLDSPGGLVMPYGINNHGQVVGTIQTDIPGTFDSESHAFITDPNGVGITKIDEGSPAWDMARVVAVNDSGQVVGFFDNGQRHFMTGTNGTGVIDITHMHNEYRVDASDINESGQVVGGYWDTSNGDYYAYVTEPNGSGFTELGTLGGFGSFANGINNAGEVVGTAKTADGDTHPFLFSHGGLTDLNMLDVVIATGLTDISVFDINNNGQLIGHGYDNFGVQAFMLSYTPDTVFDPQPIFIPSPVPELKTYAMLLSGLGLIGFMARCRKAAAV